MSKHNATQHFGFQAPTGYKKLYEREQYRRQQLESRVEAMQQEIDALKWRLHVARQQLLDKT